MMRCKQMAKCSAYSMVSDLREDQRMKIKTYSKKQTKKEKLLL